MRAFEDEHGRRWVATVVKRPGPDYKGRYHFHFVPEDAAAAGEGGTREGLDLLDIRWNGERTAGRTLRTMSLVELRRRLRQARGRGADSHRSA